MTDFSPFFSDLNTPEVLIVNANKSSFFSDIDSKTEAFKQLPFEEKREILQRMSEQREEDVGRAFIEGAVPGASRITKLAEEKGAIESSVLPQAGQTAIQIAGASLPISAIHKGVGKVTGKVLDYIPGGQSLQSALTGAGYKTVTSLAEEGKVPEKSDVVQEALLFGGGHLAFDAARKTVSFLKNVATKANAPKTELTKTGEKYSLNPIAATEIDKPRFIKPTISESKAYKLGKQSEQSAKKTIDLIIQEKMPVAKAKAEGIDLEKAYEDFYKIAEQRANKSQKAIDMSSTVDAIGNRIKELEKISKIPSEEVRKEIEILKEKGKEFIASRFTPAEILKQYKAFNKDVTRIHSKPIMTGLEKSEANAYRFLNKDLVRALESTGNAEVARPFKYANEIYNKTHNLNEINRLVERSFEKKNGLRDLLRSSKRNRLEKALGKDTVKHFDEIAKYQSAVEEKLKEFVKVKDPNLSQIRKLFGLAIETPGRLVGHFYTSPKVGNLYIKAQKAFLKNDLKEAQMLSEELLKELNQ